jgi:hypothetical protein
LTIGLVVVQRGGVPGSITLRELLRADARARASLPDVIGDGFLYAKNPVFRRVRDAALRAGFRYSGAARDTGAYYGFPLIGLEAVLATRVIPYRATRPALLELERSRPGFFEIKDLRVNRPTPNYLLHESAHAVAFDVLFGRPASVAETLRDPSRLVELMLGEAYAMCAEYFAACCVSTRTEAWFFSISSYRRHVPQKRAIGELVETLGFGATVWLALGAFLYHNFLVERLSKPALERMLRYSELTRRRSVSSGLERKIRRALNGLLTMSPEFRYSTSRLFLSALGYPRDIRRVLKRDPLELAERSPELEARVRRLVAVLEHDKKPGVIVSFRDASREPGEKLVRSPALADSRSRAVRRAPDSARHAHRALLR